MASKMCCAVKGDRGRSWLLWPHGVSAEVHHRVTALLCRPRKLIFCLSRVMKLEA